MNVFALTLGSMTASTAPTDLSHAIAIALVAIYHGRIVQADSQASSGAPQAPPPAQVLVELHAPTAAAIDAALDALRRQGVTVRRHAA